MLTAVREQDDDKLIVRLSGTLEENVAMESLIGSLEPHPSQLVIVCRNITRLNSDGIKSWIRYFLGVQFKKIPLVFKECSPAVVQQINFISNFTAGGTVESIMLPFSCESCNSELTGLFECADLKTNLLQVPQYQCPKCKGKAVFDDLPEEYFLFLSRHG